MNFKLDPSKFKAKQNDGSNVKKVIAIASGKGGVGKSSITSMLAVLTSRLGKKVGILDADITGPSIPKAFGVSGKLVGNEQGILPLTSKTGIDIVSLNLLLDDVSDPVIWRAPMLTSMIKQFWSNVVWGEKDFLFIDLPPGTGDVTLTVFQSLPVKGLVVVTSPQELVNMIVEKAVKMANKMEVPIHALVENMSYFECPDCGKKVYPFGESHLNDIASKYNIDLTAQLPIQQKIAKACDSGTIEDIDVDYLDDIVKAITA